MSESFSHLFNPNALVSFISSARPRRNYETRCPCSHFLLLFREAVSMQRWVPNTILHPLMEIHCSLTIFTYKPIYALIKGLASITSKAVCPTACLQPESLAELCQCYPLVTALVQERCTSLRQKEKEMEKDENKSFLSLFSIELNMGVYATPKKTMLICYVSTNVAP